MELAPEPKSSNLGLGGLGKVLELPMVIGPFASWTSEMLKVRDLLTLAKEDKAANL